MSGKICLPRKFLILIFFPLLLGIAVIYFSNLLVKKPTTLKTRAEETGSQNLITYGIPAEENEFPYFALILIHGKDGDAPTGICGGSLIGEEWVLTAAHCVIESEPKNLQVIIGTNRIDSPLFAQAYSPVNEIIPRPDYIHGKFANQISNDIALLRLTKKVTGVPLISIPNPDSNGDTFIDPNEFPENKYIGSAGTIIGFGVNENKILSLRLLKGRLNIMRGNNFPPDKIYLPAQKDGTNACGGDSGGPLIMMIDGRPQVVGVANSSGSLGNSSCILYSLYTSVARYAVWINKITQIPYASGTISVLGPPYFYPLQSLQESFCSDSSEYRDCDFKYFFCNWHISCQKCAPKELSEDTACK